MNEPIEEVYFNWLYSKVASTMNSTPSTTYVYLMRELHTTEFVWLLSGDDNRCEDGLELRHEFCNMLGLDFDEESSWMISGSSVLEVLIAFSRRAEFQTSTSAQDWFWIFLENLGLSELNDANYMHDLEVKDILDRFIWRTYEKNGDGGIFPLNQTSKDQTKIELWYQFFEYLDDHEVV